MSNGKIMLEKMLNKDSAFYKPNSEFWCTKLSCGISKKIS